MMGARRPGTGAEREISVAGAGSKDKHSGAVSGTFQLYFYTAAIGHPQV